MNRDFLLHFPQMVKLPVSTTIDFAEPSAMPSRHCKLSPQPNSAVKCYFQSGEKTYEESAVMRVLMRLINEPSFNKLRTQEQLGYIVSSGY